MVTTGRHHWPGALATCSKPVDDDDADNDDDDENYDGDGDGDGDDELTRHSSMCVHECALRALYLPSGPANWTATLGSTTGQHHWPGLLTPTNDVLPGAPVNASRGFAYRAVLVQVSEPKCLGVSWPFFPFCPRPPAKADPKTFLAVFD